MNDKPTIPPGHWSIPFAMCDQDKRIAELEQQVKDASAEIEQLKALLEQLTEHYQWPNDFECIHCGGKFTKHGVLHLDGCPYVAARQMLGDDV